MADRISSALAPALAWFAAPGRWRLVALFALGLAVFAAGQWALPPSDRDEARFAQASRQMLETGDLVDIRFQDDPRHKKPVGIYWLQAATASLAGGPDAPIGAYRAPSWLGAALALPIAAWALAPLVGWRAAVLAAAMLGAAVLLHVEARIAKTDAMLLAVVTLAMGCLARAVVRDAALPGRFGGPVLGLWIAVGLGVLLKGPIVLLPVLGALGWMAAAARDAGPLRAVRPLPGIAVALLVAGPWLVAITMQSGVGFWTESVGKDLLSKAASGQESHGGPPGYHLIAFWGVFWPWAALAPFAAIWAWPRRREPAMRFLLGWIVPTWLLFELVPTKLPHYVLVAYPAVAAIVASALLDPSAWSRAPFWARRLAFFVWLAPALVLVLGAAAAVPAIEGYVDWGALVLAGLAAVALVAAAGALWAWRIPAFAAAAGVGAVLVYAAAFQFALPGLRTAFVAPRLAQAVQAQACEAPTRVAVAGFNEPSGVFMLGTDTLRTDGAGAARALAEGRVRLAFVEDRQRAAFDAEAATLAMPYALLRVVDGFNYSRGRRVSLALITAGDCVA